MVPDLSSLVSALAALIAVLFLIGLAARFARTGMFGFRPQLGSRTLAIEEAVALDSRRRLVLVRCADGHVLLLTGGTNDVVVGWLNREHPQP
jgi:flagellar protein FliO/FliZ